MYDFLITSLFVQNVHRTTYKTLNPCLLIEKSNLQFDITTPTPKVSALCIPPIIQYDCTVTLLVIIKKWPNTIIVLKLLPLQTLRHCGIWS
jgi:hypothetical protein